MKPRNEKCIREFSEPAGGFSKKGAIEEARRFPQPRLPQHIPGCPLGIDILGFVRRLREGDSMGALGLIREKNSLPGVCGRVCPAPCQRAGAMGIDSAVETIRDLERYAADRGEKITFQKKKEKRAGAKIAVVGSGPAGLAAAADLAHYGYRVTVFEALPEAGGILRYGIPEFRLPKNVLDRDLGYIESRGVEIQADVFIGQAYTVDELLSDGYGAVVLATGVRVAQAAEFPGDRFGGVYFAEECLMRINLMKAYRFPVSATAPNVVSPVVVVGGGYAACDCARSAVRLGCRTTLIFAGTESDMPVPEYMRQQARREGVVVEALTKPLEIISGEHHCVSGIKCVRMDFADQEHSGKWKLTAVKGSEYVIDAQTVVVATSHRPNTVIASLTKGLRVNKNDTVWLRKDGMTSREGVFACGAAVSGNGFVIDAMASGKRAAEQVHAYIEKRLRVSRP